MSEKPDCAVCGKPYSSHNMGAGVPMCPIFACYRPAGKSRMYEVGRTYERAAIVAWLRDIEGWDDWNDAARAAFKTAATAIESAAHLPERAGKGEG